jgi:hypothetical protein
MDFRAEVGILSNFVNLIGDASTSGEGAIYVIQDTGGLGSTLLTGSILLSNVRVQNMGGGTLGNASIVFKNITGNNPPSLITECAIVDSQAAGVSIIET